MEGSDPRKGREREKGQSEKECETKRVKDRLDKQRKSQLHTRREKQKRDEKTLIKNKMYFKSEKDRRGENAFISLSLGGGRRSSRSTRTGRKHGQKKGKGREKNGPGRRVSEVGVIKPGVFALQRHVYRLIKSLPTSYIFKLQAGHFPKFKTEKQLRECSHPPTLSTMDKQLLF